MDMEIILNELSIHMLAQNVHIARERMLLLIQTIKACVECGLSRVVRANTNIHVIDIADGYNISQWRNDASVDLEARRYFKSVTVKAPLFDRGLTAAIQNSLAISEFRYDGSEAQGLGLAFMLNTLAVSFFSEPKWDTDRVDIKVLELNEENGEIAERGVAVQHACQPEHLRVHKNWILERKQSALTDGDDLWTRRAELFPNLTFCPDVETQLHFLRVHEPIFPGVVGALFDLESYFRAWTIGPFTPNKLGRLASPESERTLNQYRQTRTFICPDGTSKLFSWHLKLTPGAWRLYFMPDDDNRKCLIGYIGPHLPTAQFN